MRLYGYTCPDCGAYSKTAEGVRVAGEGMQIRCPECEAVETLTRRAYGHGRCQRRVAR